MYALNLHGTRLDGAYLSQLERKVVALSTASAHNTHSNKPVETDEHVAAAYSNTDAENLRNHLGHYGRHMFLGLTACAILTVFVCWNAFAGTLVAPNPFASAAWWLVIVVLIAPLVGFVFYAVDQLLNEWRPDDEKFSIALKRIGGGFLSYIVLREIVALIVAAVMVVAWSVLILLYIPANLWVGLVGDPFAHTTGLGGAGAFIVVVFGLLFLLGYYQLIGTLIRKPEKKFSFWIILWAALVIVGLIPAIGWSVMHGQ